MTHHALFPDDNDMDARQLSIGRDPRVAEVAVRANDHVDVVPVTGVLGPKVLPRSGGDMAQNGLQHLERRFARKVQ